jgi:hypothetical protein
MVQADEIQGKNSTIRLLLITSTDTNSCKLLLCSMAEIIVFKDRLENSRTLALLDEVYSELLLLL